MSNTDIRAPWRGVVRNQQPDGSVLSDYNQVGQLPDNKRLPAIDYSAQDFDSMKLAFTNYLKAMYPDDYNNFAESDLGMMMVNLLAYMGASMSLKADMLANESYLDTVKTRGNLRKLLQLIGVDIRGPLAATATARLTIDTQIVRGLDTITIPFAARTFKIPSSRDGGPIWWTLYKVHPTTGKIDFLGHSGDSVKDLVLAGAEFETDNVTHNRVILLEGEIKSTTGYFSTTEISKTVDIIDPSVIEGSISVSSDEGTWEEIDSIYLASGHQHMVFEKVYNDDYSCKVVFGDGVRGRIPTEGTRYDVIYRIGGGERGNIKTNFLSQKLPSSRTGSVTSSPTLTLKNSSIATGGTNAESVEHAKKYAPYIFKAQYRAVTADDYTALAYAFESSVGAAKCIAVNRQSGAAANIIDIYCLLLADSGQLERAPLTFKQELISYFNDIKMMTDEVVAVDGLIRTLDLIVTIFVDRIYESNEETVKLAVRDKIVDFFSVDKMDFGKPLLFNDMVRKVVEIPQVQFTKVDNLEVEEIFMSYNEILQLNNVEINIEYI